MLVIIIFMLKSFVFFILVLASVTNSRICVTNYSGENFLYNTKA